MVSALLKKAYWLPLGLLALYFSSLLLLLNGWVQRNALYIHHLNTKWWQDPNNPEQFGFLRNQVLPFNLTTPDHQLLYGWHILPLLAHSRHETAFASEPETASEGFESVKNLVKNPKSRLLISFHGNAGTVSQGWRPDAYRAFASADPQNIHVLTIDYRGFGHSSGSPTEQGLITDAIALVDYALTVLQVPPDRIVIQGQSLGTAVSIAVAEYFSSVRSIEFKAIVLIAAFSNVPTLVCTYSIGGIVPILSPLKYFPSVQNFFASQVQETWYNGRRLFDLVKTNRNLKLYLIHAFDDMEIPWANSDILFHIAANATNDRGLSTKQIDAVKFRRRYGERSWTDSWKTKDNGGLKFVKLQVVPYGGHNRVTTYPIVARTILDAFEGRSDL